MIVRLIFQLESGALLPGARNSSKEIKPPPMALAATVRGLAILQQPSGGQQPCSEGIAAMHECLVAQLAGLRAREIAPCELRIDCRRILTQEQNSPV